MINTTESTVLNKASTRSINDTSKIRQHILHCSHVSGHGHIPTSFSVIELIVSTYNTMKHDPNNPNWEDRDIFVLSKGHAALGYYSVLAEFGYFDHKEVEKFGASGSKFGCHADRLKVPGAEVSCGSLGHGIGVAVGIALGLKIRKSNRQVYALIGDGEANEGTVWEATMVAANNQLNNLTFLYDNNSSQTRCLQIANPTKIFEAFGCQTIEVDGHNLKELEKAHRTPSTTTKCIIANTIKGYGSKTLTEKVFEWHRRSPNEEELNYLSKELNA